MKKLYLYALVMMMATAPLLADLELYTSVHDVSHRGADEAVGAFYIHVTADDFQGASPDFPVYINLAFDHGAILNGTRVDQQSADPALSRPIHIGAALHTAEGAQLNMPADAVSIVRWVAGENSLWIRVQSDSSQWVIRNGAAGAPSDMSFVGLFLGVSAEGSAEFSSAFGTDHTNLPFNTRNGQLSNTETDTTDAEDTTLRFDLSQSDLGASGYEAMLGMEPIAYTSEVSLGNGEFEPAMGDDTGINFSGDFILARGYDASQVIPVPSSYIAHLSSSDAHITTSLQLVNTSDQPQQVILVAYKGDGRSQELPAIEVAGKATVQAAAADLLGDDFKALGLVENSNIVMSASYAPARGKVTPAQAAPDTGAANFWTLSAGDAGQDLLALFNASDAEAAITIMVYKASGEVVEGMGVSIGAKDKALLTLSDMFAYEPGDRFEVFSSEPLAASAFRTNNSGRRIWTNAVTPFNP